jgi:hypothetical protein
VIQGQNGDIGLEDIGQRRVRACIEIWGSYLLLRKIIDAVRTKRKSVTHCAGK